MAETQCHLATLRGRVSTSGRSLELTLFAPCKWANKWSNIRCHHDLIEILSEDTSKPQNTAAAPDRGDGCRWEKLLSHQIPIFIGYRFGAARFPFARPVVVTMVTTTVQSGLMAVTRLPSPENCSDYVRFTRVTRLCCGWTAVFLFLHRKQLPVRKIVHRPPEKGARTGLKRLGRSWNAFCYCCGCASVGWDGECVVDSWGWLRFTWVEFQVAIG